MSGEDDARELRVRRLTTDLYNPFSASVEELLAMALDEAGLLGPETTVNGEEAVTFRQGYFRKRANYREVTRLGALLVRKEILSDEELKRALALQKKRGDMKIGDALVELEICSVEDIEKILDAQVRLRRDMEDLEKFRDQIDSIKERLRTFF